MPVTIDDSLRLPSILTLYSQSIHALYLLSILTLYLPLMITQIPVTIKTGWQHSWGRSDACYHRESWARSETCIYYYTSDTKVTQF